MACQARVPPAAASLPCTLGVGYCGPRRLAHLLLPLPGRRPPRGAVAGRIAMQERGAERLIDRVYEGMTVVDAAGKRLGKVGEVLLGDPDARTEPQIERGR